MKLEYVLLRVIIKVVDFLTSAKLLPCYITSREAGPSQMPWLFQSTYHSPHLSHSLAMPRLHLELALLLL